ncbi:MAG: hypothetical protein IPP29_16745 [Bacteroidetes bacterium]|nr:hypothetical protein [Bacteroidota bacterium]
MPWGSDSVWHTLHVKAKSSAFPTVYANECAPDTFPGNIIMLNVDSLAWNVAPPNTVSNYLIPNPTFIVPNAGVTYIGAYLYGCWVDTNNVFISNTYYWDTVLTFRPASIGLVGNPGAGTWSLNGIVVSNTFNPSTATQPYNYLVYDLGGCSIPDSLLITVNGLFVKADNDTSICDYASGFLLNAFPGGGIWQGQAVDPLGNYNPQNGNQAIDTNVYVYNDTSGCNYRYCFCNNKFAQSLQV